MVGCGERSMVFSHSGLDNIGIKGGKREVVAVVPSRGILTWFRKPDLFISSQSAFICCKQDITFHIDSETLLVI